MKRLLGSIALFAMTACSGTHGQTGSNNIPSIKGPQDSSTISQEVKQPGIRPALIATDVQDAQAPIFGSSTSTAITVGRFAASPVSGTSLLATVSYQKTETVTLPTGFAWFDSGVTFGSGVLRIATKVAAAGEPASYTFAQSGSGAQLNVTINNLVNVGSITTPANTFEGAAGEVNVPAYSGTSRGGMAFVASSTYLGSISGAPTAFLKTTTNSPGNRPTQTWEYAEYPSPGVPFTGTSNQTTAAEMLRLQPSSTTPPSAFTYGNGCQVNSPGDFYTADYSSASIDPNSKAIIKSLTDVYNTGFVDDSSEYALVSKTSSSPTTPTFDVTGPPPYHHSPNPAPYSSGDFIEANSDAHYFALVATGSAHCIGYEFYQANPTTHPGYLSVYSGAAFDTVTHAFVPTPGQPDGTAGYKAPTAAGFDYLPSTIKKEEIDAGSIDHVMDFGDDAGIDCNCYVSPAVSDEQLAYKGPSADIYRLPYGGHIRLQPGYRDSSASAQCSIVLAALKKYGAILRDTGGEYANDNKLDMLGALGTTIGMGSYNFSCLNNLRFSNFDVLTIGTTQTN